MTYSEANCIMDGYKEEARAALKRLNDNLDHEDCKLDWDYFWLEFLEERCMYILTQLDENK